VDVTRINALPSRLAPAIVVPLALAAVAYAAWAISDRLIAIGPLDRAAFGWLVVAPVWIASPGSTGLVWARLTTADRRLAAAVIAVSLTVAVGVFLSASITQLGCTPVAGLEDLLPSLIVGAIFGVGAVAGALVAVSTANAVAGPWKPIAAILAGGSVFVVSTIASFVAAAQFVVIGVSCAPG
jgi:hypothetical protein